MSAMEALAEWLDGDPGRCVQMLEGRLFWTVHLFWPHPTIPDCTAGPVEGKGPDRDSAVLAALAVVEAGDQR